MSMLIKVSAKTDPIREEALLMGCFEREGSKELTLFVQFKVSIIQVEYFYALFK